MRVRMYEGFYNDETEMYPGDSDYMGDYNKNRVEAPTAEVPIINGVTLLSRSEAEKLLT